MIRALTVCNENWVFIMNLNGDCVFLHIVVMKFDFEFSPLSYRYILCSKWFYKIVMAYVTSFVSKD